MKVSVVVPARNAEATIGKTLAALAAQEFDSEYEVIVVDSGSSDTTPELVSNAPIVSALLHNPGGEPAGSRNLGARHAQAELLAFTDADCEPQPDWLAAGISALQRADLIQGKVIPAGHAGPHDRTVSVGSEYGLYETANMFVRHDVFDSVGGFERVPGIELGDGAPFGEDAWFAWRAKRAGATSAFADDAVVRHAVFPRKAKGYVAECARRRYFPLLVRLMPELRETFMHRHVFLSPASMRFDLALLGVTAAAGRRRWTPLVAALPYASDVVGYAWPAGDGAARARWLAARVAADAVTCAALAAGSLRSRTLVL